MSSNPYQPGEMGPLWDTVCEGVGSGRLADVGASVVVGGLDGLGLAGGQVVLAEHEDHPSGWE